MCPATDVQMSVVQSGVHARLFGGAPPVTIGRFTVTAALGAGGMGVVFAARDPELDREVAIKLVAVDHAGSSPSSQARLLTEAQTMARLSHPNVVAVHEVGTHEGRIFVAMESIDGETLSSWLERARPPWTRVLAAYVQAGHGLAAAHRAGVVHRDFKPSNAMIDRSGRVRVLDFGLAIDDRSARELETTGASDRDLSTLTFGGTPLYMAPELHEGASASALADQYAFCVSLWTALFGAHPFARGSAEAMLLAMADGVPTVPAGARVPAWLRRVLARGIAPVPTKRWSSMDALLAEIERGRARAARRPVLAGVAVVALGVVAVAGVHTLDVRRRTAACEAAGAHIDAIWNDDVRVAMEAGMVASGGAYAAESAAKSVPWLEAQAAAWRTARTESCLDADVRGSWDADTLDRSLWCLEERALELDALVRELTVADGRGAQSAVVAASALAPIETCRDADTLARLPGPPTSDRAQAVELRTELARVAALERAGKLAQALADVRPLLERARAIDWPPSWAATKLREAALLERNGDHEAAEQAAAEAYFEASRIGAWDVADTAASRLVSVVGGRMSRFDDGVEWSRHGEVACTHAGDPTGLREAGRLHSLADVYSTAGEYVEARHIHERALALREAAVGPEHPSIGTELTFLADTYVATGDYAEATPLLERALRIQQAALGPEHHEVVETREALAEVVQALDEGGAR